MRRFSSAAQERAFRWDYARRFSGQRRLAIAIFTALWVVFSIRDFPRLNVLDPAHLQHTELIFLRVAGAIGMTVPVLLWSPRAFDERWAVGLLSVWTFSCWFAALRLVEVYPGDLAWREAYPILTFALFMIFMAFRLRAITAAWLIGLCVVSYLVMLYFKPVGGSVELRMESVAAHATMVPLMAIVGVLLSIPLERAARREFMYRRTLRAAKARVEAGVARGQRAEQTCMQELVKEKEPILFVGVSTTSSSAARRNQPFHPKRPDEDQGRIRRRSRARCHRGDRVRHPRHVQGHSGLQ